MTQLDTPVLAEDVSIDWPAHFAEIEEQGFTVIPDIVTSQECDRLREEVVQAVEDDWRELRNLPGKQQFICLDLVMRSPAFVRLLENDIMHRVFSHFVSEHCILYSSTSTILRPQQEHYTSQIHNDMPARLINGYHLGLMMTLACDDFTEENGATYYLPGSQHQVARPSDEDFYANAVRVTRKAGDAVFFNPRVWHAGGQNTTNQDRVGCTVYAVRPWMKQRFDYPRMVNNHVTSLIGEQGRRFLGFSARIPCNMQEFYREPEDRLYKSGQG